MIEQRARVVAIDVQHLYVQALQRQDCARCARGEGCGNQLFGRSFDDGASLPVPVATDHSFAVGDIVVVAVAPALLQRSVWLLYALPLLTMLLVTGLLAGLRVPEAGVVSGALLSLLLSLLISHRLAAPLSRMPTVQVLRKDSAAACSG